MTTSRFNKAWLLALAGPVLLAVAAAAVALGPSSLSNAFWPAPDANIAEAAAMRDVARVRALAGRGMPRERRYPIRPSLVEHAPPSLTLEEAARLSGSATVVQLVEEITQ